VDGGGYRDRLGLADARMASATDVIWATSGGIVPAAEMQDYLARGK
jgi:D-serine dehydratase